MSEQFAVIIMGSDSDLPLVNNTLDVLKGFDIKYEVRVASAHRTPDVVSNYVQDAEKRGASVFICAAGLAAHLAGAVAARTTRPVIGIPVDGGPLNGVDALYSTVMMPGGIPVATVAVGKAGAKNAGYLAAQIMALVDKDLDARVKANRQAAAEEVMAKDAALQAKL
ncbi:MAG: 5-(carboxyamino)imidazole ribonucleotide mutase [Anaerobiospirillum succiniciproducens]|mgnify:FL=1|uniref:5-(carboxyamino)imidazole ribonucleotide mutase n=1 Tax=Anaerobiospirillum succiniciproducens TaxID=13335 RepID=UPI0003F9B634|nr:5-(carboxyamino)imidazole ribonucleotide mutase [Anaerobiospirillum succiniciproducens]MCI6863219.1 5-(carboxyamino)imidazole ribonucleotide mutase [Anaerobiospirillum succiniciproducens]MDO4676322.1 5-(carboxyamino)imidazole ribonucleotide mutase [Anaerobiospirillum succiniciproducens]MDY2799567.1 5-(carboxyamino)imidazole ribonucleotide mutase [Anaerobiospirillum succiniciproducens]